MSSDAAAPSNFTDRTLSCKDCNKDWVFTAGEQEFYSQKQFENEPIRCKECRKARKIARFRRNRSSKKEETDATATSGDAAATAPPATAEGDKPKSTRAPRARRATPASGDKSKTASTAPRVCYAFQKNECTRGDACKFAHAAASA